jgi:hypothetical protein
LFLVMPLLLVGACGTDGDAGSSTASVSSNSSSAGHKSLSQRLSEKNGYKQDANGNWVPQSDKRSSFESKGEAAYFQKNFKKQEYKTGDYSKKSWWGNKAYDRQSYAGDTDGSRFQKSSGMQGKGARESGNSVNLPDSYQTGGFATGSARETSNPQLARPSNDGIENRRKVFQQPEVIDWREQRSMSVDESKGILGR